MKIGGGPEIFFSSIGGAPKKISPLKGGPQNNFIRSRGGPETFGIPTLEKRKTEDKRE